MEMRVPNSKDFFMKGGAAAAGLPLAFTALFLLSGCAAGPDGRGAPETREEPPRLLDRERGPRIYRRLVCPQCKDAE